jgi:hypothetical protein
VYVRDMQRVVRLPGLREANTIRAAADLLVGAEWLAEPQRGRRGERAKVAYAVNPTLVDACSN